MKTRVRQRKGARKMEDLGRERLKSKLGVLSQHRRLGFESLLRRPGYGVLRFPRQLTACSYLLGHPPGCWSLMLLMLEPLSAFPWLCP